MLEEQVGTPSQEVQSSKQTIEPDTHYLENITGLTNRIEAVMLEHFGAELPIIHFTNAATGHQIDQLISSGFLERFSNEGSVKKIHVGAFRKQEQPQQPFTDMSIGNDSLNSILTKLKQITKQFYHHGLRTNKDQLKRMRGAAYSMPAAIIMDKPPKLDRGVDKYDHWIVPSSQGPDKVVTLVKFKPRRASNWILFKKGELNEVVKTMVHSLGTKRLEDIYQAYTKEPNATLKQDLALYAHDLVDAYILPQEEFDAKFSDISPSTKEQINKRREKFRLFQKKETNEVDTSKIHHD